jgi:TPR repeat protein
MYIAPLLKRTIVPECICPYAELLVDGVGVPRNVTATLTYYKMGDADCQFLWAKRLADGRGLTPDDAEAVLQFKRLTEQGHKEAQCAYGEYLENGCGLKKNLAQAADFYRKSADQ